LNINLFDVQLGVGDLQSYSELTNNGADSLPTPDGMDGLSPYYGKDIWLGAGGYAALTLPCFGLAGYYTASTSFLLHNPAFPQLNTFYQTDYGANLGGAIPLGPFLSLGLSAKRVTRKGGPYVFGPDALANGELTSLVTSIENEGVGYGLDVGFVSRFEALPFNPTLHMAWRDAGSMAFVKTKGDDAPNRQKDNLVFGAGIDGSIPLLGFSAGVEYRHATDANEQIGKKIHMGAEVHLGPFDLRTGFYQGYTTYGLGIGLLFFQLDVSKYTVEQGAYPGQNPQERVQVGLMMEIELDPNFNLIDLGGKKRRLKQRR
jgi:hypothetical protein